MYPLALWFFLVAAGTCNETCLAAFVLVCHLGLGGHSGGGVGGGGGGGAPFVHHGAGYNFEGTKASVHFFVFF